MTTTNRAIKSTSITFGLVNVLVKLHKATDSHDIRFTSTMRGAAGLSASSASARRASRRCPTPTSSRALSMRARSSSSRRKNLALCRTRFLP